MDINRVVVVDALSTRIGHQVEIKTSSKRENKTEIEPESHYSPIEDIIVLQHALMALIFKCEQEQEGFKGKLFSTLLDTFKEMYTNSGLHDSVHLATVNADGETKIVDSSDN